MNKIQPIPDFNVSELELPPEESWFFEATGLNGEKLVFLRFQATGILVRRIGPFESRAVALEWLSGLVNQVCEAVDCNFANEVLDKGAIKYQFNRRHQAVIVEDPFTYRPLQSVEVLG